MNGESRPEAAHAQRPIEVSHRNGGRPERHRTLTTLDVAAMIATPPKPVPWIVDQLVARGCVTLLAGLAGQGKSLLMQALALAAVRPDGGVVAGIDVEPARVLIVDAENGPDEIHRRVHSLRLDLTSAYRLTVAEADGFHLMRHLSELETLIGEVSPDLVILDGFRSLWPVGDENKSDEVTPVLTGLRAVVRRHEVGAVLIHHSPKGGQTYRGSSAIAAGVELAFVLERLEADGDGARRRLRCEKSRPAPEPPARWLRLASGDELRHGVHPISEAEPFEADAGDKAPARARLAERLVKIVAANGPLSRPQMGKLCDKAASNGTLRRAVEDLERDGSFKQLGDGRWALASYDGNEAGNPTFDVAILPSPLEPLASGNTASQGTE